MFVLWPNTWSDLEGFHVHLRRMYVLPLLDRELYMCLLGSDTVVQIPCFFIDILHVLSSIESRILKSPTVILL